MSFLNSSGKNILQGQGGVRPNNGSVVEAAGSTAAGSLGTTTVSGNASSSSVTGGRKQLTHLIVALLFLHLFQDHYLVDFI